jgi:4-hydroxy-tetrahydrodipicolinate synthase
LQGGNLRFRGVFSVLPTPFTETGDVDTQSLRRVVDLFIAAGVNGLTALGVTGEVARLTERERDVVLETVVDQANGRVPIIAGASADGTRKCIDFCRRAVAMKASAVMVSPPRMPKLNSGAIVAHYNALADAVDTSIVIQDYPPISGYSMEPSLLARIARGTSRARTIKLEDPPTPLKTSRILEESKDIEVDVLGGLGGVYLIEELMAGASGVMTGFAYPEVLVKVVKLFHSGNTKSAADTFYRHVPLMRFEFQEGIGMAIRKEILHRRGVLSDASIRAPGAVADSATLAALDSVLEWLKGNEDSSI